MTVFTRTDQGLINQYRFYTEPVVWVEGHEDIPLFYGALRTLSVRVLAAGGKKRCDVLSQAMTADNHPYIVVIDGDYEILKPPRRLHRRLVMLQRYSIENYFFEKAPCERLCRIYARDFSGTEYVGDDFDDVAQHIEKELTELVSLDIARHIKGSDDAILPKRIELLLEKQDAPLIASGLVKSRITKARETISNEEHKHGRNVLAAFVAEKRFVDILKGHLLFGILRLLLSRCLRRKGKPRLPNDDAVRAMLANEIWQAPMSTDHQVVTRKLKKAVRDAQKLLSA